MEKHICTNCFFTEEVEGKTKKRMSPEHWAWVTDKAPVGNPWFNSRNPLQKDCEAGKLQPNGSRKIISFGTPIEELKKSKKELKLTPIK